MLYIGGGYYDIKNPSQPWNHFFNLFHDPDVWMVGVPETKLVVTGVTAGELIDELIVNGISILNNVSNIFTISDVGFVVVVDVVVGTVDLLYNLIT